MMHLTVQSIFLGAAVAAALQEPLPTPGDSPHWNQFPDPPSLEVLKCEHLVKEFVELGNAYYIGTYRSDEAPPKDRWRSLTHPNLPYLDIQKCQDLIEEYKEKTYRWPLEAGLCGVADYKDCLWNNKLDPKCEDKLGQHGDCRPDMKKWIIDSYGTKVISHYNHVHGQPGHHNGPTASSIQARRESSDITNPPPTVECLLSCLRGPARTIEEVAARAACVRGCSEKAESLDVASNENLASSTKEAQDAHPEGVVEKRDCASDCIDNSRSKAEMTKCFQKCVDDGEWDLSDGSTPASPIQAHDADSEAGVLVEKRSPGCTSKCMRGPPRTPKERHNCIRRCPTRSLD
ncbi:hypothetical protein KVR01_013207 [Diaporthe batatas]|uniref:uncharacterized protein n=1 Tax=Diaporthe batatas TaxID=748121 RepID=UPI001D054FA3|nr:uncharacterized protein KVR01_013207 [Diaporthe batatas]KAG8156985.1 hypothetical protein KVR01_013207 [Diaporthe batatas]